MRRAGAWLALASLLLVGCAKTEVTEADAARMRKEFSQANYEAAMRKAGKTAELEREKQQAARRGGQ